MREILFRGKEKDAKSWVFGSLVNTYDHYTRYQHCFIVDDDYEDHEEIEVLPDTVGQYTGLNDKNGKKVFEGDIVKREYTLWHGETKKTREMQIGVVVYSNRDCGFQVEKKCNLRKPWDGDTIEVIGNIHDNPELMKGGEG